jgi:hypothetical protein
VTDLAFATLSYPQTACAGLCKSLQQTLQSIERTIDDIGDCFFDDDAAIAIIFLPALYGETIRERHMPVVILMPSIFLESCF